MNQRFLCLLAICAIFSSNVALPAASPAAAKIDDDSISVAEVRQELGVALGDRQITEAERPVLEAQTLGLLVNRFLVVKYLERNHLGASADDVNLAVEEFKKQLAQQNKTLESHLQNLGFTEDELKRLFAWEIGWPSYLNKKLDQENLTKYFNAYKRNFDGTKLIVRHILIKVENTADSAAVQAAVNKITQIKADIVAGNYPLQMLLNNSAREPRQRKGAIWERLVVMLLCLPLSTMRRLSSLQVRSPIPS